MARLNVWITGLKCKKRKCKWSNNKQIAVKAQILEYSNKLNIKVIIFKALSQKVIFDKYVRISIKSIWGDELDVCRSLADAIYDEHYEHVQKQPIQTAEQ